MKKTLLLTTICSSFFFVSCSAGQTEGTEDAETSGVTEEQVEDLEEATKKLKEKEAELDEALEELENL